MDDDAADEDAGFLVDFAPDGFFDGLGGFGEAGEGGEPVGGPALLAAEEEFISLGVHYGHDDGGVGAGEAEVADSRPGGAGGAVEGVGDVLWWACAFEARVDGEGGLAAGGALLYTSVLRGVVGLYW